MSQVMVGEKTTSKDLGGDAHFVLLFSDPQSVNQETCILLSNKIKLWLKIQEGEIIVWYCSKKIY